MIPVVRLGHVTLATADFEAQRDYYSRILGLHAIESGKARSLYASMTGLPAVELVAGGSGSLERLSFQVDPRISLDDVGRVLSQHGITFERRSDAVPTVGGLLTCQDPDGTHIDLFVDCHFASCLGSALTNYVYFYEIVPMLTVNLAAYLANRTFRDAEQDHTFLTPQVARDF